MNKVKPENDQSRPGDNMNSTEDVRIEIRSVLPERWSLKKQDRSNRTFSVLDSYVCSLLRSGSALLEFEGKPATVELLPAGVDGSLDAPLPQKPFGPDSLPNQELRNLVEKSLGTWRLGVRVRGSENIERYRLENEDGKGIARISLRSLRCVDGSPITFVRVQPYRGYDNEVMSIRHRLEETFPAAAAPPVFFRSLPASVRGPSGQYPAIQPSEEAREAVVNLQKHILDRVRYYEPGVTEDSDPEILHQYRVSLRRMRSLTALLKEVFSPAEKETLGTQLKSAMQGTNRLRDLDVQIVELTALASSLPGTFHKGADRLLSHMRRERRLVFKSVRKSLLAASFGHRFSPVIEILTSPSDQNEETISAMLSAAVRKRYRKITKEIQGFDENVTPDQLHGLRVSCKKIRYLLEFFPQLLRQDLVKPLLKDLKKLQSLLGRYNDLTVMEAFLLGQAEQHTEDGTVLMAIGAIIMQIHERRNRLSEKCITTARDFCSMAHKGSVRDTVKGESD